MQARCGCSFPRSRVSANLIHYQGCIRERGKAPVRPHPRRPPPPAPAPPGAGPCPAAPGALRPWGLGGLGCEAVRGVTLVTIAGWSVFFSEPCLCNLMYFRNCWGV